jgi:outer membrane protein OmpA-like peptidoglycan-associated protein
MGGRASMNGALKTARDTVVPLLVSVVVSVGFVAFAGKAVLWTRFSALDVPPDQVVKAVPQSEAVAVGASLLLIFGVFGAIAALLTYLVDRGGRATPGMSRAVLLVVTLEAVTVIAIATELSPSKRVLLGVLVLVPAALALAVTFARPLVALRDTNPPRPSETLGPERDANILIDGAGRLRVNPLRLSIAAVSLVLALPLGAVLLFVADLSVLLKVAVGAQALVLLGLAALLSWVPVEGDHALVREIRLSLQLERAEEAALRENEEPVLGEAAERQRVGKHRPYRFAFKAGGAFLMVVLAVFSIVVPALVLDEWWIAVSLGSATVLGFGLWRIAGLSKQSFVWFGFAVFLSVPLFGTLTLMARNQSNPQVQPMALIRTSDGPDEAIQGLYVTEADERVYFATVAIEGCDGGVRENSGRLLWVPKSEVVAMALGPSQSVDDAAKSSLEMSYALTRAVETPTGDRFEPESSTDHAAGGEGQTLPGSREHVQRLESVGSAVRPDFGAGLRLEPEDPSPGQVATLRMSNPKASVEGFGGDRSGRVLRLGGVEVDVSKERVSRAENAEFVMAPRATALKIHKQTVYTKVPGEGYVPIDEHPERGEGRFVKVEDSSVLGVEDGALADGMFLRLGHGDRLMNVPRGGASGLFASFVGLVGAPFQAIAAKVWGGERPAASVSPQPTATMRKDHQRVPLEASLWRQAWHEDHIRFKVPEDAEPDIVSVECDQLAGEPLLRVERPPTARITVRMNAGTGLIRLDSRRSIDKGGTIESQHWRVAGLRAGSEPVAFRKLPPRLAPYRIRLSVTDDDGEGDSAELQLLRLPMSFFGFGDPKPERRALLAKLKRAVVRAGRASPPVAIEIDGHADDVGTASHNLKLSLERAENVRDALLTPAVARRLGIPEGQVPITIRSFGESCPVDPSGGRLRVNRRVEVFVLGSGSAVRTPKGCHAGRVERDHW